MKLFLSKTSPFARKVRMTAHSLGLLKEIEMISVDVYQKDDHYKKINPLIKIPALMTREEEILKALDRKKAGAPAPPEGLFLWKVYYPRELDNRCREL